MNIYTIGFTKKSAEEFFGFLRSEKIKTLIDVRLNNASQLSAFARKDDLAFFLKELCGIDYQHYIDLAPTKDILNAYKKKEITWEMYEDKFLNLMARRHIEKTLNPTILDEGCLLCSEHEPHLCHRRLVVEYLNEHSDLNLTVKHLY